MWGTAQERAQYERKRFERYSVQEGLGSIGTWFKGGCVQEGFGSRGVWALRLN